MTELRAISLKCSSCGGSLEITPDMTTFACGYCGCCQVVERRGGTVSLKIVADAVEKVQRGTDRTAAELALKRLAGELEGAEAKANQVRSHYDGRLSSCSGNATTFFVAGLLGVGGTILAVLIALASGYKMAAAFLAVLGLGGSSGFFLFSKQSGQAKPRILAERETALIPHMEKVSQLKARIREEKAVADGTGIVQEDYDLPQRPAGPGEKTCPYCGRPSMQSTRQCACGYVWPGV